MNKEIGDVGGVKIFLTQEGYEELKKQDTINKEKILSELQEENEDLQERINKAIEVIRLCNSPCAKETIQILKGEDNE